MQFIGITAWLLSWILFALMNAASTRDSECTNTACFTLFQQAQGLTSTEARQYCSAIGQRLAVIPDHNTQDAIRRLVGSRTRTGLLAWIAGRRGSNTRWKNPMGGFMQNPGRLKTSNISRSWCSGVKLSTFPGDNKVFSINCSSTIGYRAVCELQRSCSTDTSVRQFDINSVCHVVSDVMFTSWLDAQDHCERAHFGSNLAYSVITRGSHFTGTFNGSEGYLWTGFQRQSWVWQSSAGSEVPLTYSNCLAPEPGDGDTGECLVVDLTENGVWKSSDCDVTREYIICEGGPPPSTTSTTNSETSTGVTSTTDTTASTVTTAPTSGTTTMTQTETARTTETESTTSEPRTTATPTTTAITTITTGEEVTTATNQSSNDTAGHLTRSPDTAEISLPGIDQTLYNILLAVFIATTLIFVIVTIALGRKNCILKQTKSAVHIYANVSSTEIHNRNNSDVTSRPMQSGNGESRDYLELAEVTRNPPGVSSAAYSYISARNQNYCMT